MEKNDILDLILKAAAIYLFILAINALFTVVEGLVLLFLYGQTDMSKLAAETSLISSLSNASISRTIGGCLRFILYIILGRNLFNGGSWLKYFFGEKNFNQPKDPVNSMPSD
ncbi:hypothetical protein ACFL2O_07220 [Thermodesulfobacteriota bacterium]